MNAIRRWRTTLVLLLLLAALAGRLDATLEQAASDLRIAQAVARSETRAVERVAASVVSIEALGAQGEEFGSGIVVDPKGLLLTAMHVVRHAASITVTLDDRSEYAAEVIATDPATDLALLQVKAPGRRFTPAVLGRDEAVRLGETVFVVGNPFGLQGSVSRGILSGRDRRRVMPGLSAGLLQTDAPINPGSSGGALANLRGEVVGLVTAILSRNGTDQGVGFALPASELRYALPFLRRREPVQRAWIGVRVREVSGRDPGLLIVGTTAKGPAAAAGLRPGDVILGAAGRRIETLAQLRLLLRGSSIEKPLRLRIRRGAGTLGVDLTPRQKNP